MFPKSKKIFHYLIAIFITLTFFIYLFSNINHTLFPNSDFFQYIDDGYKYLNFKLPSNIHPPPLAPIMICLSSKLFPNIEYPELFSAHLINIILASLTIFNVFLLLYKYSPLTSIATILLLATNKLNIVYSLNVTNEIIYAYFLTLVLLLYQKKHYQVSYFLSGLLFLLRYESIIVPISIFLIEYFFNKKQFKLKNVFIAFTPILIWLIILNFHSLGNTIIQNAYIVEILNGRKNIPNTNVFNSLIEIFVFEPVSYIFFNLFNPKNYSELPSTIANNLFLIIFVPICLMKIIKKGHDFNLKIFSLILIFHLIFLSIFPNFSIRYLIPIIWIFYFLIAGIKNKIFKTILIILLITFNLKSFNRISIYDKPKEKYEYRLTAEWLNNQSFDKKTIVFIYDPPLIDYFLHNSQISIDYSVYTQNPNIFVKCQDQINCVINNSFQKEFQYYVISTNTSSKEENNNSDKFTEINLHHVKAFQDGTLSKNDKLKLVTTIGDIDNWAKIYQFFP